MRIKLDVYIPVDCIHGMTMGREFDVDAEYGAGRSGERWVTVMGDAGEEVKLWASEYKVLSGYRNVDRGFDDE